MTYVWKNWTMCFKHANHCKFNSQHNWPFNEHKELHLDDGLRIHTVWAPKSMRGKWLWPRRKFGFANHLIWWTLSLPYKLWGVSDPGWGSPLRKFQNLIENHCLPRPTPSCHQECKGNIFFWSWAGRVTVFGRVQKFPWRAAPARIWRPHSSYGGLIVCHLILHTYMFHIIRKVGYVEKVTI